MNNWYHIQDIDNFLEQVKKISFNKFVEINNSVEHEDCSIQIDEKEDIDSLISDDEVKNIAMPLIKKRKNGHKISDKILHRIIEDINSRIISNTLNKLVASGVLESAFDSELNDFIFWTKE
jgi:predicted DNA binding protein